MADLHVGVAQTYATFADASAASADGDTFIFHPGTYAAAVVIPHDNQTITTSQDGAVAIDGGSTPGAITLTHKDNFILGLPGDGPYLTVDSTANCVLHYGGDGFTVQDCTLISTSTNDVNFCVHLSSGGSGGTGAFTFRRLKLRGPAAYSLYRSSGMWFNINYSTCVFTCEDLDFARCYAAIDNRAAPMEFNRITVTGGYGTNPHTGIGFSGKGVVNTVKNSKFWDLSRAFVGQAGAKPPVVLNCTLDDNAEHFDVRVALTSTIQNCTLTNGAVDFYPTTVLTNCLLWNITGTAYTQTDCVAGTVSPYVDASTQDYQLFVGSEAVDIGVLLTGIVDFDYDGVARPQGAAPDAGAYEYEATGVGGTSSWNGAAGLSFWNGLTPSSWNGV